jgi:5'-nucleotidase
MVKKTLYVDMDNVLVDFATGIARLDPHVREDFDDRLDEVPGIFSLMDPMPGAVEAYRLLADAFDTYILSTAPWLNPTAWSDKLAWVHRHLDSLTADGPAYKRLIVSHHKYLCVGDFLVDDRDKNGAGQFGGELVRFGSAQFPDWQATLTYLLARV